MGQLWDGVTSGDAGRSQFQIDMISIRCIKCVKISMKKLKSIKTELCSRNSNITILEYLLKFLSRGLK